MDGMPIVDMPLTVRRPAGRGGGGRGKDDGGRFREGKGRGGAVPGSPYDVAGNVC